MPKIAREIFMQVFRLLKKLPSCPSDFSQGFRETWWRVGCQPSLVPTWACYDYSLTWQQAKKSPHAMHKSPQQEGDMHVRAPGTSETKKAWSTAMAPTHQVGAIFEVFRRSLTIDRWAWIRFVLRKRVRFHTLPRPAPSSPGQTLGNAVHYQKLHLLSHRWALIRLRQRMRMGVHFDTHDVQLETTAQDRDLTLALLITMETKLFPCQYRQCLVPLDGWVRTEGWVRTVWEDQKFLKMIRQQWINCVKIENVCVEIILITCRYFRSAWRQERQSEDDPTTMDKLCKDRKFLCGNHIDYMQIFSICLAAGKTVWRWSDNNG